MPAPVVIRNFDAVDIATDYGTYYINRARLEETIKILSSPRVFDITFRPAVELHDRYPLMSATELWRYIDAAKACIEHEVVP